MENAIISDNKNSHSYIIIRDFSCAGFFTERRSGEYAGKGSIMKSVRLIKLGVIDNAENLFIVQQTANITRSPWLRNKQKTVAILLK